jgi:phosphinothricin acetyltransferase
MTGNVIRPAIPPDCVAIARIYNHYIRETVVTFEEDEVSAAEIQARLGEVRATSLPWLVIEEAGSVSGYAYATRWKGRSAYRYSAESTIYLEPSSIGRGLGTRLYGALLDDLRSRSLHVVIGGIALPNQASVALHERLGFSKVAHYKEVGFKFSRWIDVGYWQTLLSSSASHRAITPS